MVDGTAPEAGDVVWLEFAPTRGHEQSGHRPALVLSPSRYNDLTGLAVVCPITSRPKGHRFEVAVDCAGVQGVVLSDHVRSLSWRSRNGRIAGRVPPETLDEVRAKLKGFLSL